MRDSEVNRLIGMVALGVAIFLFLSRYVGAEIAWSYISNVTIIIPYIITGIICLVLGISTRKWGGVIFGGVAFILLLQTLGIVS